MDGTVQLSLKSLIAIDPNAPTIPIRLLVTKLNNSSKLLRLYFNFMHTKLLRSNPGPSTKVKTVEI